MMLKLRLLSARALAQKQGGLARRHEAGGSIGPERGARRIEIERAELMAVEKAIGAGRLALAPRLQAPAGQSHRANPFLRSINF